MARGLTLIALALLGCEGAARRFDRAYVDQGIRERTGHGLATITEGQVKPGPQPPVPPTVNLADGLSVEEAVEIALSRNAELALALEDLGVSRAELLQAGLLRNPAFEIFFPVGRKELEVTVGLPLELGGQLFFRRKAAAIDLEATALRLIQSGVELAAQVKAAHAEVSSVLIRARRLDEIVRLFEESVRLTRIRMEAGDVSGQTLRIAELDLLRARGDRDLLSQELGAARERLNLLLGFEARRTDWQIVIPPDGGDARPPAGPEAVLPEPSPAEDLVAFGLEHRLEARVASLELQAAEKRVGLAWASVVPVVSPLFHLEGNQPGPGIGGEFPAFDFNQGGISRAKAQERAAVKRVLAVRDRIAKEIREAREVLVGERRRQSFLLGELLPRAEEAVRASQRAYELGEETFIFVLEASRRLVESKRDQAEAALRLRKAEIELERSLGGRMPQAPPGTRKEA